MQPIQSPALRGHFRENLQATTLCFHAGQLIFNEGQRASRWYEVVQGTVRTCRFHLDGQRHLTGFFFSGDVFGAEDGHYATAAEAVTDVVLRCYRVDGIARNDDPTPQKDDTVSILFRAMSSAQRYQFIMGCRTAAERLAAFLLCLQQKSDRNSEILLPMSRNDIADFLGLTIHTVSRTFTDLSRRGLIAVIGRHSIAIRDRSGLCALAGEPDDSFASKQKAAVHPSVDLYFGNRSVA
jgi:CRP-like cAMP-binding protein